MIKRYNVDYTYRHKKPLSITIFDGDPQIGMDEDITGTWVKYEDIKHLINNPMSKEPIININIERLKELFTAFTFDSAKIVKHLKQDNKKIKDDK